MVLIAQAAVPGSIFIAVASESEDEVVAIVNGESIHRAQLIELMVDYKKQHHKMQVSAEEKTQLLKNMILRNLILKDDAANNLRKSEMISKRVKEYEDKLVLEAYIREHVFDFLSVSEEETKQYYLKNKDQYASPPKVKASHILLRTETEATQVLEKLKAGESFAELAKQHSIDLPMALEGGSMGIIAKGKTLPQLEEALFILNEGEISPIVKTRFGWHILRVDQRMKDPYIPYEEVRDKIKVLLQRNKEAKAYDAMTQQLEKDASITIFEDRL